MTENLLSVYRRRGQQLADAMRLCRDDPGAYAAATALLAVHSAIAYNDAVQVKLAGGIRRGDDHKDAFQETRKACKRARLDSTALRHLQKLLGFKTDISYGARDVEAQLSQELSIDAERFESWVMSLLKS